ncbi:MAG TPA: S53 family peptidase [Acetobacteraceae bacterium]|nr:S53 family peptidase [Acetobacteraceae bacterium]
MATKPLAGSTREKLPGATAIGKADPSEQIQVTLVLRRKNAASFQKTLAAAVAGTGARHISRETFAREFGADPEDLAAVKQFAHSAGLTVAETHGARRTVVLSGTIAAFNAAFGVDLQKFQHAGGSYRGRTGAIHLPETLHGRVEAVLGLDNRPAARAHFRYPTGGAQLARAGSAAATSFTPPQLAGFYNYPAGTGAGTSVGIIELGGGERPTDLATYFAGLGISPAPKVTAVSVDGASNDPTTANSADGEVMLDIEVIGAIAPAAAIAVYFAPNTDAGFLDAITTAIHDATNKPAIISISWGGPESSWTQQSLTSFDSAFQDAATLGITVCVACGDSGSSDGTGSGDAVDFPASSPHVLACGGTSIQVSGNAITSETVWNDGTSGGATGGGISTVFALPAWQNGLAATLTAGGTTSLSKRGVPDVSGDADPETGYTIRIDGTNTVIGGTSAVAPLWAALIARINGQLGTPVGFVNATLYANPAALRDVTEGNNGDYAAAAGWDACTGLGTPDGAAVAGLFAGGVS